MRTAGRRGWIVAWLWLCAAGCGPAPETPNLVLVTFDTLRADHVGPRGEDGRSLTPHLDALSERGRTFERAFTTMPTTAPAHASMLTGLQPHEHGIERNGDRATPDGLGARSLQRLLGERGYETGAFVTSSVFGPDAMGLAGFDVFDAGDAALRPGLQAARAALAWAEARNGPFFLWLHLYDPHSPYGPAARKPAHYPVDPARYGWVDAGLYADAAARAEMAELYAAGVREADAALGALLAGLGRIRADPVLLVTADHGELLAEQLDSNGFAYGHGAVLGTEVLRVPLVLQGPGISAATVAAVASVRDVYTTLLAAAGLPDPEASDAGRSDLRGALPEHRVVAAERREFTARDLLKREIGADAYALVRAHAVAVSDGEHLVVLGEDGAMAEGADAPAALREAAAVVLADQIEARAARVPEKLDDATRDQLRALGYLE
jgi:arylsulfatase A-like enzyme